MRSEDVFIWDHIIDMQLQVYVCTYIPLIDSDYVGMYVCKYECLYIHTNNSMVHMIR